MNVDVVVIGGGVIGLSTAWRAAEQGLSTVMLSDPGRRAASMAAVGGLSFCMPEPMLAGHTAVVDMCRAAKVGYGRFVEELEATSGSSVGYRSRPTLMTKFADETDAALIRAATARACIGLPSERLDGADCLRLEPALSNRVDEGLLLAEHHQIDSRALMASLQQACKIQNVEVRHARADSIVVESGRAVGVLLPDGERIGAENIVLCAGSWSGTIAGLPLELVDSVHPVAGQVVLVQVPPGKKQPKHDLRNSRVYIASRADGTAVVGATKEERGFDLMPTVGSARVLAHEAIALWPGAEEWGWSETAVGLRPKSPDGLPIIGATSVPGFVAATGHFRNGIMFADQTAAAVVDLLMNRPLAEMFNAFSAERFRIARL